MTRFSRAKPDFIFSVFAGDVRDDFFHVETFACAVVAFETGCEGGFEDEAELFAEGVGEVVGEGFVEMPDVFGGR